MQSEYIIPLVRSSTDKDVHEVIYSLTPVCYTKRSNYNDAVIYGPRREKTCLQVFANNKGADQPAHPHRHYQRLYYSLYAKYIVSFLDLLQAKFQFSS